MKTYTIIADNKLIGMVKLKDEVANLLFSKKDLGILLTQDNINGDATALSFKLDIIPVEIK